MPSIHDKDVLAYVEKLCKSYHFKFNVREPLEDVFHNVVLQIITTKYLERFNPSIRPLHNYLSGYIYNYFCKVYKKEGYAVNQARSLEESLVPEGDTFTLLSTIDSSEDVDVDASMEIEYIIKCLDKKFPYFTYLVYNSNLRIEGIYTVGEDVSFDTSYYVIPRSAAQVFKLLYLGFNQTEIKNLLLVSKSWTSKVVSRIVSLEELRDFAKNKGFKIQ